jgi:small subunit ribosomal protein S20
VANTKSAIKRMRQNDKRRQRNRTVRTRVRSALKTARTAVTTAGSDAATAVAQAIRTLDKAVTKGVIHHNTASRKKSLLARRLNLGGGLRPPSDAPRA